MRRGEDPEKTQTRSREDTAAGTAVSTWGEDLPTMLGGTRPRKGWQTLWPRPGSRQLCLAGNQPTWRSSTKAAATKSCREQHQDRPDDPDPLPYPEYDHQGHGSENQGEETPHEKFTQRYEDPWNKDARESLENQQTSNKDNPTDRQGHSYHNQAGSHYYKDQ